VDHGKFAILVRNSELVWEVHKRLGPATAKIFQLVLDTIQMKLKSEREEKSGSSSLAAYPEIKVKTSEVAKILPDISTTPAFVDLVDPHNERSRSIPNGTSRRGRRDYSSDEDDLPEVKINGTHRYQDSIQRKQEIVADHLQSLAEDSTLFIRPANGKSEHKGEEEWTVNLLSLRQFLRQTELERVIDRKYGQDALRLVRIIAEKTNIDQDQVTPPNH
jgi:hypothetical protein